MSQGHGLEEVDPSAVERFIALLDRDGDSQIVFRDLVVALAQQHVMELAPGSGTLYYQSWRLCNPSRAATVRLSPEVLLAREGPETAAFLSKEDLMRLTATRTVVCMKPRTTAGQPPSHEVVARQPAFRPFWCGLMELLLAPGSPYCVPPLRSMRFARPSLSGTLSLADRGVGGADPPFRALPPFAVDGGGGDVTLKPRHTRPLGGTQTLVDMSDGGASEGEADLSRTLPAFWSALHSSAATHALLGPNHAPATAAPATQRDFAALALARLQEAAAAEVAADGEDVSQVLAASQLPQSHASTGGAAVALLRARWARQRQALRAASPTGRHFEPAGSGAGAGRGGDDSSDEGEAQSAAEDAASAIAAAAAAEIGADWEEGGGVPRALRAIMGVGVGAGDAAEADGGRQASVAAGGAGTSGPGRWGGAGAGAGGAGAGDTPALSPDEARHLRRQFARLQQERQAAASLAQSLSRRSAALVTAQAGAQAPALFVPPAELMRTAALHPREAARTGFDLGPPPPPSQAGAGAGAGGALQCTFADQLAFRAMSSLDAARAKHAAATAGATGLSGARSQQAESAARQGAESANRLVAAGLLQLARDAESAQARPRPLPLARTPGVGQGAGALPAGPVQFTEFFVLDDGFGGDVDGADSVGAQARDAGQAGEEERRSRAVAPAASLAPGAALNLGAVSDRDLARLLAASRIVQAAEDPVAAAARQAELLGIDSARGCGQAARGRGGSTGGGKPAMVTKFRPESLEELQSRVAADQRLYRQSYRPILFDPRLTRPAMTSWQLEDELAALRDGRAALRAGQAAPLPAHLAGRPRFVTSFGKANAAAAAGQGASGS